MNIILAELFAWTSSGSDASPAAPSLQGVYACENNQTQNTELKAWGGYKYAVRSDYGATHSTVPSALHGLDQEFPGAHINVVVSAAVPPR